MNLEEEIKSKIRKPRFRKRAIEKLLNKLLVELKIEDIDLIDKLTYSLVAVISDKLEGQRFTNDEIASMFKAEKSCRMTLCIHKDISVSLVHSDDLSRLDLKVKVGYVPVGYSLTEEEIIRIAQFTAKRIHTEYDYMSSLYYILSTVLKTKDIAISIEGKSGIDYFTNGIFNNSPALWQAFIS